MKEKKSQPVIIEVERIEGDNRLSFSVRGSSEWLDEVLPVVTYNLGFICARVATSADEQQKTELQEGATALISRQPYKGEYVTVKIAEEKTK